jgi:hypothetical protein
MAKKKKKEPHEYHCPHCGEQIYPAKMMAEVSVANRDVSSQRMSKVAQARWNRKKLYGF